MDDGQTRAQQIGLLTEDKASAADRWLAGEIDGVDASVTSMRRTMFGFLVATTTSAIMLALNILYLAASS